ncbi:MAG: hypothetical protein IMF03_07295 [Proteobacteria bacterium]|nr:hypothetical protein [Pseudomonadota bacterium]
MYVPKAGTSRKPARPESQQLLQTYRAGFIARPYESEFSDVEDSIKEILEKNKIQAQHYIQQPGIGYALDHLLSQISDSHFGIVDITGCNPNPTSAVFSI